MLRASVVSYRGQVCGIVSAVRALESRLARSRCELRLRVPHEDVRLSIGKLAQW